MKRLCTNNKYSAFQLQNVPFQVLSGRSKDDFFTTLMVSHENLDVPFHAWTAGKLEQYKTYIQHLLRNISETETLQEIVTAANSFIKSL